MRWLYEALVFTLCWVFLSCATGQRRLEVIPSPPVRIVMNGYSFMPLPETGWVIGGRTADRIVIGKQGAHGDESLVITAALMSAKGVSTRESVVESVRKLTAVDPNDKRYRNVRQDVSGKSVRAAVCAVSDGESEDHGALTRSGRRDPMIIQQRTIVCVHPTLNDKLVVVAFSHRHYAENRDPAFPERAQSLFESIEFSDR